MATAQALDEAGLACTADAAVWTAIWEKVAFNAALNSICTATQVMKGTNLAISDGRALAFAVVDEVLAVAQAQGIAVHADASARRAWPTPSHAMWPQALNAAGRAGRQADRNRVHQRRGGGRCSDLGVPVPCTRTLLQIVRLVQARQTG